MSYNWIKIKENIIHNIKSEFDNSTNPNVTNFDECVDLLGKFPIVKCNLPFIDGLTKTILPALHDIFVNKSTELNSLKILIEDLEPFLKKIIYVTTNADYSNNHHKSLGPLLEELGLSQALTNKTVGYPQFLTTNNLPNYIGNEEFLEFICRSYIARNQVHNSPDWPFVEFYTILKSVLIIYVYAMQKHYSSLNQFVENTVTERNTNNLFDDNTKMLYDFISFGSGITDLKRQIITSFILYYLHKNGETSILKLQDVCNSKFNTNADINFYERLIRHGIDTKFEYTTHVKDSVHVTTDENQRISSAINDFDFKENLLITEIKTCLQKFGIENLYSDIIKKLQSLFENNYNIDVSEIYDKGTQSTNNTDSSKVFLKYLENEIGDKTASEELFLELLIICQENDFLHRVSAGKVFSNIVNPSQLENYLRIQKREIYLDTQIVLYALCYWYNSKSKYDNVYFKATKDLIEFYQKHKNLNLKVSNQYIREVAYQIREALLLIPMEDINFFDKFGGSNNVFYQFYSYLKENEELEYDVSSFSDFLSGFDMYYDDVFDKSFLNIASDLIKEYLMDFSIASFDFERCSQQTKDDAFDIIKNGLNLSGKSRHEITITNDSSMLIYLSKKDRHINEPIFATWDNVFYYAREKYLKKYRGSKLWHLYSPSKLLNHLSLLEFKINAESITNEFMSIIDAFDFQTRTNKFLDTINDLLDIGKEDRRKYIVKLKEFSKKYVYELDNRPEQGESIEQPLSAIISTLSYYYKDWKNPHSFDDFKNIFAQPDYFERVTALFNDELEFFLKNARFSSRLKEEMDKIIVEFKNNKKA